MCVCESSVKFASQAAVVVRLGCMCAILTCWTAAGAAAVALHKEQIIHSINAISGISAQKSFVCISFNQKNLKFVSLRRRARQIVTLKSLSFYWCVCASLMQLICFFSSLWFDLIFDSNFPTNSLASEIESYIETDEHVKWLWMFLVLSMRATNTKSNTLE